MNLTRQFVSEGKILQVYCDLAEFSVDSADVVWAVMLKSSLLGTFKMVVSGKVTGVHGLRAQIKVLGPDNEYTGLLVKFQSSSGKLPAWAGLTQRMLNQWLNRNREQANRSI